MSIVVKWGARKPVTPVKNLGWLLRHWKDVSEIQVNTQTPSHGVTPIPPGGAELIALLKRGAGYYHTTFQSAAVLADFLHRPVFYGLPVTWDGVSGYIESPRDARYHPGHGFRASK